MEVFSWRLMNKPRCDSLFMRSKVLDGIKLRIKKGNGLLKNDGMIVLWKPSQNEQK